MYWLTTAIVFAFFAIMLYDMLVRGRKRDARYESRRTQERMEEAAVERDRLDALNGIADGLRDVARSIDTLDAGSTGTDIERGLSDVARAIDGHAGGR